MTHLNVINQAKKITKYFDKHTFIMNWKFKFVLIIFSLLKISAPKHGRM